MNSFSFWLSQSFLVWFLSAFCNSCGIWLGQSKVRELSLTLLVFTSLFIIGLYVRWWTKRTSYWFYGAILPNLIFNPFDLLTLVDFCFNPSNGFLSEYLTMEEPFLHNVWMYGLVVGDATVGMGVNYMVFHIMQQGRSIRNWVLFMSAYHGFTGVVWAFVVKFGFETQYLTKLLIPSVPIIVAATILTAVKEPQFVLKGNYQKSGNKSFVAAVTKILLILTLGIIFFKILVTQGYEIDFWKSHDYTLNLLEVNGSASHNIARQLAQAQFTIYALFMLPMTLISLSSLTGKWFPSFIWDLSVVQLGCWVSGQTTTVVAVLFWEMPSELKGIADDLIFWTINIIPVVASILQVWHFSPYVCCRTDEVSKKHSE